LFPPIFVELFVVSACCIYLHMVAVAALPYNA